MPSAGATSHLFHLPHLSAQKQQRVGVKAELRLQIQTVNGFKQDTKGQLKQFRDGVRDLVAATM